MRRENKKNNYLVPPSIDTGFTLFFMRKLLRMPLEKLWIVVEVGAGVCTSFEPEGDLEVIGKVAGQLEVPG